MSKQNGLTMLELLVTIGIVGIVLTVAVPSLSSLSKENKLINTMNTVSSIALYARSEAISRGRQILVCRSSNNKTCSSSGDNIIVVQDNIAIDDEVGDGKVTTEDSVLKTFSVIADNRGVNVLFKNFKEKTIVFSKYGVPTKSGQIVICDDRGSAHAKGNILNMGGQLRTLSSTEHGAITCTA